MIYKKENKIFEIKQDTDLDESPREWDNVGTMVLNHQKYDLPNEADINTDGFKSWKEIEVYLRKEKKAFIIFPVFMYDHSGISISVSKTYSYNCRWDSGQIGFIYCTKEDIKKEKFTKKKAEKCLIQEIDTYNDYLTGNIYEFVLYELKTCKCCSHIEEQVLDSCGGFYGSDFKENGLLDHAGIKDLSKWTELKEVL